MKDSTNDSKDKILQYCPGCGKEIIWTKDIQFCLKCGMYLIPFVPKDKIQEWLGKSISHEEIEELYRKKPDRSYSTPTTQSPQDYPTMHNYGYRERRPWKWGAALGVPILSILAKLIASVIILLFYIVVVVDDFATLDIEAFMAEHLVPIYIIEFATQVFLLFVPYWFTARFFPYKAPRKERWESLGIPFGLKPKRWITDIAIGIGAAFLMTGLVLGAEWVSSELTQWIFGVSEEYLYGSDTSSFEMGLPTTIGFTIIYSLFMIFSIGPSEEVLFRGFTQKGLQDSFKNPRLGKIMALFITALYFSLFHIFLLILDPPSFFFMLIPYLSLSLVLGSLYMWRKNLISAITAHALYNIIQFLIYILVVA